MSDISRGLCAPASFALIAAMLAAPAHAEADDQTIIVTAPVAGDDAQQRADDTPGGTDVVRAADYADKTLVSLRDALAFSPGVYLQPRFGQEVRISIRGSGLSRSFHMRGLTLLQDGVPINLADDNGDFQELEPIFFDHLEVYRGANALRFGSGTLGGAINGVTPTGRTAEGLYARIDGGSFGMVRGLVSLGVADGPGDAWIAASADSADGDRNHARRHSLRLHANAGLALSDRVTTRFYVSLNRIEQELPGALTLATALDRPETGNIVGDQARDITSIRLQNRTRIDLNEGSLDVGAFVNMKALFHPIYQVIDQDSTDWGGFARLERTMGRFGFTLGANARVGSTSARRFVNVNGARGGKTFAADQDARTLDVYGEARFSPDERVTLVAGAVYADGWRRQRQSFPATVTGKATFDLFSPKFGLLIEPAAGVQLFANYSRSGEMPTFVELAQVASFVPVRAQRAWTAEIGTRGRRGIASWDIAAYRATLKREMLQYSVGPDIPASTFNAGRTLHQGIEAAAALEPLAWLRLRAIWQHSDFRFRDDARYGDNRLPVIPRDMIRAEIRLGTDALHVSPAIEWVPQGAWADYANTLRAPGYTLVGLTAGARVASNVDLFLDARNLGGEKGVGDISAAIMATGSSMIFYPVERRAVLGGVRARF